MALPLRTDIVIVTVIFTLISLISVVLRFAARHKQTAPLRWDDHLILVAVVGFRIRAAPKYLESTANNSLKFLNLGLGACTIAGMFFGLYFLN
jgi:hypothetical protein